MTGGKLSQVRWRPPTLEGSRVLLRGWESGDAEAVFGYASDPEVTPYMAWARHRSMVDTAAFLDEFVASNYRAQQLDYALCLNADPNRAIGGIGAYVRSPEHKTMELGYVLARQHWGHGLVVEAARLLIDHVFSKTNAERIYAPILSENAKSRRAAEKMGLTLDGVLRSSLELHGRRWDEAIYSVLRAEWVAGGKPPADLP